METVDRLERGAETAARSSTALVKSQAACRVLASEADAGLEEIHLVKVISCET